MAIHAPSVSLYVAHKMASSIVSPYTSPRAVFPIEVVGTAKLKPDPDVWAKVPDVLVEGLQAGGGVACGFCQDGNQETCNQTSLVAHCLLQSLGTLLAVVDSHVEVHATLQ